MYQVEDEPIETIHLYVVREGEKHPSLIPVIISVLALSILVAIGILVPHKQPEQRVSIRVPAVLLGLRTFSASIRIVPTGVKAYPAKYALGILTLSNGSVISQTLPKGFVATANSGVQAVFIPAGDANGYGVSTVQAHLLTSGINLSTLSINEVIGTSLFIRNLSPFTGGSPAYSVKFITSKDRSLAISNARAAVVLKVSGLHFPCQETITDILTWRCQFITFHIPSYMHVTSVMIQGKYLLVDVVFVAHPRLFWVK